MEALRYKAGHGAAGIMAVGLVGALIVGSIASIPIILYLFSGFGGIAAITGVAAIAGVLILTPTSAIYYANNSNKANQEMKSDIQSKTIEDLSHIKAHGQLNAILFADKETFQNKFTLKLVDSNTQIATDFTIDLTK